jgi:glycosyltransferase involved in cell wall biosynthesis
LRVALVHDWLLGMRGGEKVLEALLKLVPQAEIFTLLVDRQNISSTLAARPIHASWLQKLPGVQRHYRKLLPWMPGAIERFDLSGFDLVISSSHCVAKGVKVPAGVPHLCYCHTPMRYAWDQMELYLKQVTPLLRSWARRELEKLQAWDAATADRVTQYIANGQTVADRITKVYGRESVVVHPPVDTEFYQRNPSVIREDFYLVVSALAPNKRIDLALHACERLKRNLIIIGSGENSKVVCSPNTGPLRLLGWASNEVIRDHYQRCRALLFPGVEDFGIVPLEAQACGTPVIAYGHGGATETVRPLGQHPEPTGVWFHEPESHSLVAAIERFEAASIDPQHCRANAERFRAAVFDERMREILKPYLHT